MYPTLDSYNIKTLGVSIFIRLAGEEFDLNDCIRQATQNQLRMRLATTYGEWVDYNRQRLFWAGAARILQSHESKV